MYYTLYMYMYNVYVNINISINILVIKLRTKLYKIYVRDTWIEMRLEISDWRSTLI